jgi:hypothetical protein
MDPEALVDTAVSAGGDGNGLGKKEKPQAKWPGAFWDWHGVGWEAVGSSTGTTTAPARRLPESAGSVSFHATSFFKGIGCCRLVPLI